MQLGDIVWVEFPYEEAHVGKKRPALVLDVHGSGKCLLAYGSSKQIDASNPLPGEVVVSKPHDLQQCGLRVPTRFDLRKRVMVSLNFRDRIGTLPRSKNRQLVGAAKYCGLINPPGVSF